MPNLAKKPPQKQHRCTAHIDEAETAISTPRIKSWEMGDIHFRVLDRSSSVICVLYRMYAKRRCWHDAPDSRFAELLFAEECKVTDANHHLGDQANPKADRAKDRADTSCRAWKVRQWTDRTETIGTSDDCGHRADDLCEHQRKGDVESVIRQSCCRSSHPLLQHSPGQSLEQQHPDANTLQ